MPSLKAVVVTNDEVVVTGSAVSRVVFGLRLRGTELGCASHGTFHLHAGDHVAETRAEIASPR